MNFFHLIFPCANIFFVLRPPPHKFSNGPSLSGVQFGLKSYAWFQNWKKLRAAHAQVRFEFDFNSTCAQGWPPGVSIFFALDGKFPGWGLLSCQIPRGGDEKRGQMPRPPSTLQHFLLITQSNSAVLSILMSDFLV